MRIRYRKTFADKFFSHFSQFEKLIIPNGYLLAFFLDDAKILNFISSQPIIFTFAAHKKILIFCKF